MPANAQEAPAKWGPGCDKALLEGDFSLLKAPPMPCSKEKKDYLDGVIDKVKIGGLSAYAVLGTGPDPNMLTPQFTALYLRAFADPGQDLLHYHNHLDGFLSRLGRANEMIKDARLDWDIWRAWLLFENTTYLRDDLVYSRNGEEVRTGAHLKCAREILWAYLTLNSAAILKDPQRRAWWLTRLTADLEAPGGRPQRRWFLLLLLSKEDPKREALQRAEVKRAYSKSAPNVPVRQPHPLDPFLIVTGENPKIPAFGEAVTQMALNSKLSLTVLGIDPAAQPATRVDTITLGSPMYAGDEAKVIYQESWSAPRPTEDLLHLPFDYEWNIHYRQLDKYYGEVHLPGDRTDGVFFFVYNARLYVWPKAKMDAGVIQLLRTANLIDAVAAAGLENRGIAPLTETLVKEAPEK